MISGPLGLRRGLRRCTRGGIGTIVQRVRAGVAWDDTCFALIQSGCNARGSFPCSVALAVERSVSGSSFYVR